MQARSAIGKYSTVVKEDLEREERYLGRVHEHGVNVHERAAEILLNPDSKPHELHRLLLELFPSPRSVRLVTTNFDNHFSIAAEALFDSKVETFYGPLFRLDTTLLGLFICMGAPVKTRAVCSYRRSLWPGISDRRMGDPISSCDVCAIRRAVCRLQPQ